MTKYIIPFFYTLYTRTKGMGKKVAYLFTFIFPVLLYAVTVAYNNKSNFLLTIVTIIISLIGTMSIYEIGYIRNDVFTIKKEKNPTLRLRREELEYVEKKIIPILIIKYGIAILSIVLTFVLGMNFINYIIGLILIEVFYFIHNSVRGKLSIGSFFVLSTLRYITPLMVLHTNVVSTIIVFILIISIPRTLEKAAEKKFNIKNLSFIRNSNLNILRAIYYIILLAVILIQNFTIGISLVYIVSAIYYLVYRGLIAIGYLGKKSFKRA
ncbi:hypothetical protein [uncultured Clostridium sp.]|jgi:hypothetical protein|uniref:hypothetical protein n=1 Tax=uncultured Clostridium sp. TaxID=59620 RepID=UPI00262D2B58|nr:hypothetical protein [uncultured Clostridium sp.]